MDPHGTKKILFINSALTHYYNLVLNRLNEEEGIALSVLIPSNSSSLVGAGVYQNRDGLNFTVLELEEYRLFGLFLSFRGLPDLLRRERFDVIITSVDYAPAFFLNPVLRLVRSYLQIPLIMKSIPFRVPLYHEAICEFLHGPVEVPHAPGLLRLFTFCTPLVRLMKCTSLFLNKCLYNHVDAHVNYIDEAFEIFGSYGVDAKKIFITGNSPDTDLLLSCYDELRDSPPILPPCEHRIVHVGRLVAWKRVDMLIRAFVRLKRSFPDAELLIIGTGPDEDALKQLAEGLGCGEKIRFLGGIYDPKSLGHYLVSSSVYVLAGMGGLSINDAMCFGLPVVCSVCDGTEKKLVRDGFNGCLFMDGNEDDLVEKMAFVLEDPRRRRQMGENSLAIIRTEVNIHTVISGYMSAINHVSGLQR